MEKNVDKNIRFTFKKNIFQLNISYSDFMLTDLRRQNKLTEQKKRIVFIELHTASGKGIFQKCIYLKIYEIFMFHTKLFF